tara:strand:- start:2976 stop:4355 length:1380 start_codon:yes stop_codon:yes gene_type:complete
MLSIRRYKSLEPLAPLILLNTVKSTKFIFILLLLIPANSQAEKIKVFLDETRTDYIMAEKMDCKVHKSKRGITLGFKAGNLLFGIGPEITFGGENSVQWEKTIQGIIARYQELCARFNTGTITKKEYDGRIKEIDAIAKEAMLLQVRIIQRVKDQSKNAFKELAEEAGKSFSDKEIGKRIEDISLKVENLPPLEDAVNNTVSTSKNGLKVIVAEGIARLGDDTTLARTKAMALNNARRSALEEAVGILLRGSSVIYNRDLVSDLVVTATKGLIVKEEILDGSGLETNNKHPIYRILLRAYIKPVKLEKRGNFKILKAAVFKAVNPSASKSPVFQDNDEIQIKIKINSDYYPNLFSVDQDGRVIKLFPNPYVKSELLPAQTNFVFPDDSLRAIGIKLRVKTPQSISRTIESVLIIATKERIDFLTDKNQEETTITDLMRELSELDPSLWAERTVGYEVRK